VTGSRAPRSSLPLLERVVLSAFVDSASYTRVQLTDATGLSRAVLSGVVDALLTRGELVEVDAASDGTGRGRPARRFRRAGFQPPVLIIGLHKDTRTTVTLVDADGSALAAGAAESWAQSWERWAPTVRGLVHELTGTHSAPRLVVIAAPFPVQEGEGQPRIHPLPPGPRRGPKAIPPQSDWLTADPRPGVAGLLDCPAIMVNDANLAALGEAHFGAGRPYRGLIHLSVRSGIGAGFVFEGRLFTGANGFAGELVHVQVVDHHGDFCVCGNRGCLATMTRGTSVLDALMSIYDTDLTFEEVETLIEHDDAIAVRFFQDLGSLIGRPLGTLVTAIDPDCIVVDAGLGRAAAPLIDGLTAELTHRCPPMLLSRLAIVPGALPNAWTHGAIAAANAQVLQTMPATRGGRPSG
jgi:predicted NBD/HSP70 family sugar kinase